MPDNPQAQDVCDQVEEAIAPGRVREGHPMILIYARVGREAVNAPPALTEFLNRRGRFLPTPGVALDRLLKTIKGVGSTSAQSVNLAPRT
jgi:hypothetical protein